jgi:membrane-bound ClpP family serine protease
MQLLIWSVLLLLLGLALIALEVLIPSGGILGVLAAVTLASAVALGFFAGPLVGLAVVLGIVLAVPAIIAVAFKVLPNTPMGRRVLLDIPSGDAVLPDIEKLRELKQLVGRSGVARTIMLPSGMVEIGGRMIDAISPGIAIDPGQRVRVVEVRGTRVVVRPIAEGEPDAEPEPSPSPNPLDQPIEALGIEDFEGPMLDGTKQS